MSTGQATAALVPSTLIPDGILPDLEYLIPTSRIIIQEISPLYNPRQYDILDEWGRRIYSATRTSDHGFLSMGEWTAEVFDCMGRSLIIGNMTGRTNVFVTSTQTGMSLGRVSESRSDCCGKSWTILDESEAPALLLDASACSSGGPFEVVYPLYNLNKPGEQHGRLAMKTNKLYEVGFPVSLDPKTKAVLIYVTLFIQSLFFN